MEDTIISTIALLRNGPLILKDAMLKKKGAVMLLKNKISGADFAIPRSLKHIIHEGEVKFNCTLHYTTQ